MFQFLCKEEYAKGNIRINTFKNDARNILYFPCRFEMETKDVEIGIKINITHEFSV